MSTSLPLRIFCRTGPSRTTRGAMGLCVFIRSRYALTTSREWEGTGNPGMRASRCAELVAPRQVAVALRIAGDVLEQERGWIFLAVDDLRERAHLEPQSA